MKVTKQLRSALLKWKEDKGLSNRKVGELIGISAPSIGNWLTNENAEIRDANYQALFPYIEKYLNESVEGFIQNSESLKNYIFHKIFSLGKTLDDLNEEITFSNREDLERMFAPGNNVPLTPKTLSEIFAVLDIEPKEAPISGKEKDLLFVNTIKKSLYYNVAPIVTQSYKIAQKGLPKTKKYIGDFKGENIIGVEIEDNSLWFRGIMLGDILVMKRLTSEHSNFKRLTEPPIVLIPTSESNILGELTKEASNILEVRYDANFHENKKKVTEVIEYSAIELQTHSYEIKENDNVFYALGKMRRKFEV